jgi:ATP-dependent DNA ligase
MIANTIAAVRPTTFPARPINGGPLELALPKPGHWYYEPKYNGWRALVHVPTGAMFNRKCQPLSITGSFGAALRRLRAAILVTGGRTIEWLDCEVLDRRHALGRGTLLVFDYIAPPEAARESLQQRKALLSQTFEPHDYALVPLHEMVYGVQPHDPEEIQPQTLYRELKQLNAKWGCQFYEGLVAKRSADKYPVQLRSPQEEFVGWVKHRWAY